MPLVCKFGPQNVAHDPAKRESWQGYARLNQAERQALVPSFGWSLPTACMGLAINAVVPCTLDLFVRRSELLLGADFYKVAHWAAQWIDDRDPADIRLMAENIRKEPMEYLHQCPDVFRHWVGDRFMGFSCNVALESNIEWIGRLNLPATCEGDDLRVTTRGWGECSPDQLVDRLLKARGAEREELYGRLYRILKNCLWLGPRHPKEVEDDEDLLDDAVISFRGFQDQVSTELAMARQELTNA